MRSNGIPLAVSLGDPSGIGPDIVIATWQKRESLNLPPLIATGCPDVLRQRAQHLGVDIKIKEVEMSDPAVPADGSLGIVRTCMQTRAPGKPDNTDADGTIASIRKAVQLIHDGQCRGLVTGPINKKVLYNQGFEYPGHTEYLEALAAEIFGVETARSVMMLATPELRTVPVTIHIPIHEVPGALTIQAIVETARITVCDLVSRFGITRPRIAISGLNPHAGEQGAIGDEESRIIEPAIQSLLDENLDVSGPWPADTLFHAARRRDFDAVICMYHDQALIPVKALFFDEAVNVTLGLPFIRTSPDHGTAYDIAGTGKASPASFIAAVRMADEMSRTS